MNSADAHIEGNGELEAKGEKGIQVPWRLRERGRRGKDCVPSVRGWRFLTWAWPWRTCIFACGENGAGSYKSRHGTQEHLQGSVQWTCVPALNQVHPVLSHRMEPWTERPRTNLLCQVALKSCVPCLEPKSWFLEPRWICEPPSVFPHKFFWLIFISLPPQSKSHFLSIQKHLTDK